MSYFQFKYFKLRQRFSALKFGTDAMLLGAFSNEVLPKGGVFLDVGTGSGAIAMMLTQRFPERHLIGVEIDDLTSLDACFNFSQVTFYQQLSLINEDFFHWQTDQLFDGIISNPPYYINTLQGNNSRLNNAKHAVGFSFDEFLSKSYSLTKSDGLLMYIVPSDDVDYHLVLAQKHGWFLNELIRIYSKSDHLVRCILVFKKSASDFNQKTFVIRNLDNSYSKQYIDLTKEFHNKKL